MSDTAISDREWREACEFLAREARALDAGQYDEWLAFLHTEITYRLRSPILTMERADQKPQAPEWVVLMDETRASLEIRVRQLTTPGYSVSENPRSLTRRFVSNILVESAGDAEKLIVDSAVLVYRSRGGQMEPHVFSIGRRDVLDRVEGRLVLRKREAVLDETVIGARSIVAVL